MADQADQSQRTEPATEKKRDEARKKGNVMQSREISTVAVLLASAVALMSPLGTHLSSFVIESARSILSGAVVPPSSLAGYHAVLTKQIGLAGLALAPIVGAFVVVAGLSNVLQVGPLLSAEALAFRGSRIDPIQGAKRFVSVERIFELLKALAKLAVVVAVAWRVLEPAFPDLLGLMGASPATSMSKAWELSSVLILATLSVLAVFAAADYAFQRWNYERRLRMTKQEVRDEMKQREGDPSLKGRRRQRQQELSRHRMIAEVAEADVVITNPTHFAIALKYNPPEQSSPEVVAKGRNHLALRIRREAEANGVPIVENPPLAQVLYRTAKVGREIPEDLYKAVAEVLAYVYRLRPRQVESWRAAP